MEEQKGGKERGGGEFQKERERKVRRKGEKRRRGGEKLDTDQSIKLDLMNIKFRYLDLINTINLPMVPDKCFNG